MSNPERPFTFGTDELVASGTAAGRPLKSNPAGWPNVAQGFPPDSPGKGPHMTKVLHVVGQWLTHLSEIQMQNWTPKISMNSTNAPRAACWLEETKRWIVVGEEECRFSTNGYDWTVVTNPAGIPFQTVFAGPTKAVALDNGAKVYATLGTTLISNTETANDALYAGAYDPDGDVYVIFGALSATNHPLILVGGPAVVGVSDMTRKTGFAVFPFATPDNVLAALTSFNCHVATNGAGRILILASYHSTGEGGQIQQFLSEDNGGTWAETADVMADTTDDPLTGVSGLVFDAENEVWVATKFDGKVYRTPDVVGTWTEIVDLGVALGNLKIDGHLLVAYSAAVSPSGSGQIVFSRDGGFTWRYWRMYQQGAVLAFSPHLSQFLFGCTGNTCVLSMSVGPTPGTAGP